MQGLIVALNGLYLRLAGVTSGLKFHLDGVRLAEGVLSASIKGSMKAIFWICNYVFWIRIREIVILTRISNSELRIRIQEAK